MANYDLGMLRVFVLVYETGSVTHASERLFISQPSVSYTLRKLRSHFGDALFQRKGHHLEPTLLADELYPKLRRLLESLDDIMEAPGDFQPDTSTRRFRLRMTDVGVSGLLPSILRSVRTQAPGVTLEVEALNLATVLHDLRTGAADAAICTTRLDESDIRRDLLFNQEYVGLCAADHPRISEEPALGAYEDEEHVAVAISTGHTALDVRVRELGINRRVSVVIPTFSSLPDLLEGGELISYAPTGVASRLIRRHDVRAFRLPFDVPVTQVALYTLRRELPAADMEWFRHTIMSSVQARHTQAPNSVRVAGGFA
ncbi:LysR family transcriptional regulator [Arthrobacter sunyaminii]|uniref:LysR family transcriptional regulator n=1 Tax=Arthrobacter sunyaminii TaxID=2816859 RepID=A0A975S6T4_9MICC|nr:LysR family transcriptional regulator [Arthrobacter sunyaminii]MBO0907822.1 LysR family transcriptional regulator [Arthrobacter sunyaminii]QWQ36880.1 LysR family transcriptional regulator [Arthrobacter sunyaminii]